MRLDYEAVDGMAGVTRLLPVKALSPDSHALLQEGPDERRRFIDWGVFHVETAGSSTRGAAFVDRCRNATRRCGISDPTPR